MADETVTTDEPTPEFQPRQMMGRRLGMPRQQTGPTPRGFFEAAGDEAGFYWNDLVLDRWRSFVEPDSPALTEDEFAEIAGERPINFYPGITRRQAEFRAGEHDHMEWSASLQGRPIAQFAGGMLPIFADPGVLATLPAGGASMGRAAGATTLRSFLRHSMAGAGKAGFAGTAAEVPLQLQQAGRPDINVLAMSAAAPFALMPAMSAVGRGVRSMRGLTDAHGGNAIRTRSDAEVDPAQASAQARDMDGVPAPPIRELSPETIPARRVEQLFEGYQGGARKWVQDLSAGRGAALRYAERLGIDPRSDSMRDFVRAVGDASDSTRLTSPEHNLKVMDALNQFRAGERDLSIIRTLQEEGLIAPVGRVDPETGRVVPTLVDGEPELRLTTAGRRVDEALQEPNTPANRELLNKLNQEGPGAIRTRVKRDTADRTRPDGEEWFDSPRVIDPEAGWDDAAFVRALDGARLESADARPRRVTPMQRAVDPDNTPVSNDAARVRQRIREMGGDPDRVGDTYRKMINGMDTCVR